MMLVAVHMRWVLSRWHPTMMAATGAGADPVCPAKHLQVSVITWSFIEFSLRDQLLPGLGCGE
jgi:hypothetical protein